MAQPKQSFAVRLLKGLADLVCRHRALTLWSQVVLMVVCAVYTYLRLEFHTSRNDLVGGEKEYHKIYLELKKEFPAQDDLVVVVEGSVMERNRQFVERLGAKLEAEIQKKSNVFSSVFFKADLKMMGRKALLFIPEKDLKDLYTTLHDFEPFFQQFTHATNLVSLVDLVNSQFSKAKREENAQNASLLKALPALERIIAQATDGIDRPGMPASPGIHALLDEGQEAEEQIYLTYGKGRIYLLTTQAVDESRNGDAVERLRQLVSETQVEVPGLNVGMTGEPVLEYDEMAQSQRDSTLATVVSLALVALIFIYGYHETGRPLKATFCLLVGISYTMGFTTLVVGHLNILTITFVPILIGLAIDFGVHLITRYEEELRHGRSQRTALEKAMVNTGMGIFTGAFTTAGAFFAMAFTDFDGIKEMGIICGGGLLVSLVPMMTLLPVLLLRGRQNVLDHELGPSLEIQAAAEIDKRARLENIWLRRPLTVTLIIALLSVAAVRIGRRVSFDYNLLNMQSAGLPAVIFQDKLIQSSSRSLLFGAVVADNLTQATNLMARLTNLPSVSAVESMAGFLTDEQSGKLRALTEIKQLVSKIHFMPVDEKPVSVPQLTVSLFGFLGYARLAADDVRNDDPQLFHMLSSLAATISRLRERMLLLDPKEVSEKLGGFQRALFRDVVDTFRAIQNQDDSGPLTVADLPAEFRERFVGVTGKHLLQVYPKRDVWDRSAQEEFVRELRTVDKRVTGTPVQLLEYTTLLRKSFEEAAGYSLIAISILVLIHFRSIACLILSLIPVGVGFLWMVGLMGLSHVHFNPANIMTLPLIVGIGVTNGIHILNRFAEEHHPSILAKSTGKAVLVSGLTTIAGFGSLVLAKHRGIESLGYIMATGTATCMVVGLTLLPAILNLLSRWGWQIGISAPEPGPALLSPDEPEPRQGHDV